MTDVAELEVSATGTYVNVLASVARALSEADFDCAAALIAPIAGEVWTGRFTNLARGGSRSAEPRPRAVTPRIRVDVLRRDRFHCTYCGQPVIPLPILVAIADVFPDRFAYHPNYKRGHIHPAFWLLAPEIDHRLAHSRGGASNLENLTTLHTVCNARKSDALLADVAAAEVPSRDDRWDGLLGWYPAIVAAGNRHGARHSAPGYHERWMRLFGLSAISGD